MGQLGQYWNPLSPLVPRSLREGCFVVLATLMAALMASCSSHGEGTTGHVALRLTATSSGGSISWSASVDGRTSRPADVIHLSGTTPFSMDFDIAVQRQGCQSVGVGGFCFADISANVAISGRTSDHLTVCLRDVGGNGGAISCGSSTGPRFLVLLITSVG
jgi:hypothetical protein